ncbi:hypothetical protein [Vreelandella sp. GE22]
MNVNDTMLNLYLAHERLTELTFKLQAQGRAMAASELLRESQTLGRQLTQLEGVLGDYAQDIAVVNAQVASQ